MKNILTNFYEYSKIEIEELVKNDKKLKNTINKLQLSRYFIEGDKYFQKKIINKKN